MRKKQKTLIVILAILALIAFIVPTIAPLLAVRADTVSELQSKLSQAEKSRQEAESALSGVKSKITDAKGQRETLDVSISALENEIYALSLQIEENEKEVRKVTEELEMAEKNREEYTDVFKTRVRVMYERNDLSFLNLLFGAKSFSDLLKRVETVSQIVNYDKAVLGRMQEAQNQIEDKKAALEEAGKIVELNRDIQKSKKAELDASKAALNAVISDLESDEAAYRVALDEADAAEAALRAEIKAMTAATPKPAATPAAQSETVSDAGGRFCWPTPSTTYITSPFGTRFHPVQKRNKTHTGIDIGAGHGASIVAAEAGTVLRAGWNSGYGNYVVIDHGGGTQTLYGHCSALLVQSGQAVSRGQKIALVGSTGVSTGPHLHFEVLINGSYTDPMGYFG